MEMERLVVVVGSGIAAWGGAVGGAALPPPPPTAPLSTCFLERWRPRCMWRAQYFWLGTASLEHRHFLPSVRRQRPGSGSMPLP